MATYIGVDFGSENCVLAQLSSTAEASGVKIATTVLQNELGGFPSSTLVSFSENGRLMGEAAVSQVNVNAPNTVTDIPALLGIDFEEFQAEVAPSFPQLRFAVGPSSSGGLKVNVLVQGESTDLLMEQVTSCLLNKLKVLAQTATKSDDLKFAVSLPPSYTASQRKAFLDAAKISDFQISHLLSQPAAYGIVAALRYKVAENEAKKNVIFFDIGKSYTSAFVVSYAFNESPSIISLRSRRIGGNQLDQVLYNHFYQICKDKYKMEFAPNTKSGGRLLVQCQRVKKVLSANATTSLEVDHLYEGQDVKIPITRDQFYSLSSNFLGQIDQLISEAIEAAGISLSDLHAVEVVGGSSRVPFIQELISSKTGIKLSFSLDSANAAAVGSAYSCAQYIEGAQPGVHSIQGSFFSSADGEAAGLSDDDITKAKELEAKFVEFDKICHAKAESKNAIESFILDTRSKSSAGKYSGLLPTSVVSPILDEAQNWLDDEADYADLETLQSTLSDFKKRIADACPQYFQKVEEDRVAMEKSLEEAAKQAATEQGDEKDDHDNRKLKKADRMRLVKMNKDEGNSLFRDGNIEQALQRYVKSLTHTEKFFDLSEEDKKEVADMRLSLYLNLSQCYLKLEKYPRVIENCTQALAIQPQSVKALFRRGQAYLQTKELDKARTDVARAAELDKEDKAIPKLLDRINAEIAKAKEKEKKMYGKMFA